MKSTINRFLVAVRRSNGSALIKRLVPRKLRQLAWKSVTSVEEFDIMGSRMFIPPGDRNLDLAMDQYEPGVSECLRNLLKPGMVFCDVGANFGIFTLLGSRAVGPNGWVFAFEPVPSNRRVLERNIALNGATNVTVIAEAVSDTCGTARIFLSRDAGCHSISSEPLHYEGEFLEVAVTRLDQVKSLERIDVLKIDVEGAELEVLAGLGNLQVDQVILEYNSERIAKRGMTGQEFVGKLKELGFVHIVNLDDPVSGLASLSVAGDTTFNLLAASRSPKTGAPI